MLIYKVINVMILVLFSFGVVLHWGAVVLQGLYKCKECAEGAETAFTHYKASK